MFAESYIQTAALLFDNYTLQSPLSVYLKDFFKHNRKFGSRDRKYVSALLYGIYRLGRQDPAIAIRDKMIAGSFLSGEMPPAFFEKAAPALMPFLNSDFEQKRKIIFSHFGILLSLPFLMSDSLSSDEYFRYLFRTSRVFIRVRKQPKKIIQCLTQHAINFELINDDCIALPLNTRLADILPDADHYVIQDLSSQRAGVFFNPQKDQQWWDCCAASGGKSLLLLDKNIPVQLTVSDIRPQIIANLHKRFTQYGFDRYSAKVIDLTKTLQSTFAYDHIIADLPCSGAGTWSRSPEQFYFFNEQKLNAFHQLQCTILQNILPCLKPGGSLYYLTCSLFQQENEKVIASIDQQQYKPIQQRLLKAFDEGGDCLYFCEISRR